MMSIPAVRGTVVMSRRRFKIGERHTGLLGFPDNETRGPFAFVVVREASLEEFHAQVLEMFGPAEAAKQDGWYPDWFFYEVLTD